MLTLLFPAHTRALKLSLSSRAPSRAPRPLSLSDRRRATGVTAAYVCVVSLAGALVQVVPTRIDGTMYNGYAIKLKNSTHILCALGVNQSLTGARARLVARRAANTRRGDERWFKDARARASLSPRSLMRLRRSLGLALVTMTSATRARCRV